MASSLTRIGAEDVRDGVVLPWEGERGEDGLDACRVRLVDAVERRALVAAMMVCGLMKTLMRSAVSNSSL